MWNSLKRWWKYLAMKARVVQEEKADPKVQLEQALDEAKAEHRRITDTAAMVIAHQKRAQAQLDAKLDEYDKARASAAQALVMIEREVRQGNDAKVALFGTSAENLAYRSLELEREVEELEQALLEATNAAERAKAAVAQNAIAVQSKLKQKDHLLSVLDQAKMQEAVNGAMSQITDTLGDDVPTYAAIEQKIRTRQLVAQAKGELTAAQIDARTDPGIIEIEAAQQSAQAQALLAQMRAELGLPAPKLAIAAEHTTKEESNDR